MNNNDPLGKAVLEYSISGIESSLTVHSNICDDDELQVSYLFRGYEAMPHLEQLALNYCKGSILDVGACAGAHSVYLQNKGEDVTALERSQNCVEVLKKRGVEKILHQNFYESLAQKYDTILLLMNGIGVAGNLTNAPLFFAQLKKILKPGGQVLIDSSDLIYLYENEDGSVDIDLNDDYYGEVEYSFEYKGIKSASFPWLYLGKDLLQDLAFTAGFKTEIVADGEHYDYLARLTLDAI